MRNFVASAYGFLQVISLTCAVSSFLFADYDPSSFPASENTYFHQLLLPIANTIAKIVGISLSQS